MKPSGFTRKQVVLGGLAGVAVGAGAAVGASGRGLGADRRHEPDVGAFQTRPVAGDSRLGAALPPRMPPSSGEVRVVDPVDGSDENLGTDAAPWRTLRRAFEALEPGQTALVKSGRYEGRLTAAAAASGSAEAPKTLAAYPGHDPVLTGLIRADGLEYWRFRGLTFAPVDLDTGFYALGSTAHLEFVRVVFRDCPLGSGTVADDTCTDLQWFGCGFRDNGRAGTLLDHGLYLKASRCVVAGSVFAGNSSYGVHLYPSARDNFVVNNTIVENGIRSPDPYWAGGLVIGGSESAGNQIVNNVVAFNAGFGARTDSAAQGGHLFRRNVVWGNTLGGTYWDTDGQVTETGTIRARPRFVDRRAGDYRLRPGSPGVDRAIREFTPACAAGRTGRR